MSIYQKIKDTAKKIKDTAVAKLLPPKTTNTGGGGSWSAPKVNNVASVAAANTPKKDIAVSQLSNTINSLKNGAPPNQSVLPKNQSTIPSPSAIQIVTNTKTGKTSMVDVTKPKIDVQAAVDKATGGKAGGSSKYSASTSKTASISDPISIASSDYSFGLGDIGTQADIVPTDTPLETASLSTPSSQRSSQQSSGSGSSGGGGASGSSSPTSSRGTDTMSARDKALADAMTEAQRISREVGILSAKEESAAQDAVVSDTTETQSETDAFNYLKEQPDNGAITLLNEEIKNIKDNLRENEKTIGKTYDVKQTGMEGTQASETGQASVGIANAGGYLGFSGSGQGVMLSLAESHRAELVSLESERQQALQEARNAAATRRYDIVRLKANEIARIDQEKYERTKDYNAEVKKEADKTKEEAKKLRTQNDILTAIKGGAKTVESIFNELGGRVDINDIKDTLDTISGGDEGSFKLSPTQTAGLLGSGMSAADIKTLVGEVSENGYTEELRSQLTPLERAAVDKVFREKATGDNTVAGYSFDGTEITGTTLQVIDGFTTLKELTPTVREKVKKEMYALGFGDSKVPAWFDATFMEEAGYPTGAVPESSLLDFYKKNDLTKGRAVKPFSTLQKDAWNNYRLKKIGSGTSSGSGESSWETEYD